MLNHFTDATAINRRHFFRSGATGIGVAALANLLQNTGHAAPEAAQPANDGLHFAPQAKRIIHLCQSGGPAQHDLFDYKPLLNEQNGKELPESVRGEQRLTGMSANQSSLPLAGSQFKFAQHGQSGAWLSELLPHHREIVDDVCFIKSMYTEAINHDPAITFFQTGSQIAGRPSLGAWLSYGLGSVNKNLPSFIVLVSSNQGGQPRVVQATFLVSISSTGTSATAISTGHAASGQKQNLHFDRQDARSNCFLTLRLRL